MYQHSEIFNNGRLYDYLEEQKMGIKKRIDKLISEESLRCSDEIIIQDNLSRFLIDPLILNVEKKHIDYKETTIDVSSDRSRNIFGDSLCEARGIILSLFIPYEGDPTLWGLQPDRFARLSASRQRQITPSSDTAPGKIEIRFEYIQDSMQKEQIDIDIASEIGAITSNIDVQKQQLGRYHKELESFIKQCLLDRKKSLNQLGSLLDSLNIPIKPRNGMPNLSPIKVNKRLIPVSLKTHKTTTNEPGISQSIFLDILSIVRFMGRTFEETAQTFSKLEEPDLRNIFLAALNGYFEGEASGEVFRKNGKTDICIKEKAKAAFVAECKIWHGQKSLSEALDQLLGYLTWRDCKAALVLFNKENGCFSKILDEIPKTIRKHPQFLREGVVEKINHEGEWGFVIRHNEKDDKREIILHVFVFNLYCD